MSLPMNDSVDIKIALSAGEAANLAHQINFALSRAKDAKERKPGVWDRVQRGATVPCESQECIFLHTWLSSIRICNGISLEILPDCRTPGTSAYSDYSEPYPEQYISCNPLVKDESDG